MSFSDGPTFGYDQVFVDMPHLDNAVLDSEHILKRNFKKTIEEDYDKGLHNEQLLAYQDRRFDPYSPESVQKRHRMYDIQKEVERYFQNSEVDSNAAPYHPKKEGFMGGYMPCGCKSGMGDMTNVLLVILIVALIIVYIQNLTMRSMMMTTMPMQSMVSPMMPMAVAPASVETTSPAAQV